MEAPNYNKSIQELSRRILAFFENYTKIRSKMIAFAEQEKKNKGLYLKHGWFPFPQIPLSAVAFNINDGNIDAIMEQEIEDALDEIENDIYCFNPEREAILREAFWAHRTGRYALSIPVFLAQADGIAVEAKNVHAFSRQPGSRLMDKVEFSDEVRFFSDIWFAVLVEDSAAIRMKSDRVPQSALNRHAVLHGLSINYPTKINSAKAISFLSGINWLLKDTDS